MPHINKQMASFFLTTKCNLRCVYCYNAIFGKFILFDKHGMDLLLSMCRDSSSSTMHIKAEFMTFVKQFLDDIEIDLRKLEVY